MMTAQPRMNIGHKVRYHFDDGIYWSGVVQGIRSNGVVIGQIAPVFHSADCLRVEFSVDIGEPKRISLTCSPERLELVGL